MTRPIAYFCAEYALDSNLPIYAGGLGILAGDYLREAADQKKDIVAVGLFYDFDNPVRLDPILEVEVPIQDKKIKVQVFKQLVGSIPIYLLSAPPITHKLYVADKETRLKQEIILGIGGLRALEALKIHPVAYHLNEGHSAFLALELIRHEMQERKVGFEEAVAV